MKRIVRAVYHKTRYFLILLRCNIIYAVGGEAALRFYISRINDNYIGKILRRFGAEIGTNCNIKGGVHFDNISPNKKRPFENLEMGDNCFIGSNVFFDIPAKIKLSDEVVLSAGVKLLTHQDCGDRMMKKYYPRKEGDVFIGEGSWLGVNAVVLAGVSIGKCCVVAAGAVVTEDVEDYTLVGGVPAKVIKKITK